MTHLLPPTFPKPILAIETSCDDTSAAVLDGLTIKSNVVSSQIDLHRATGGVVPEVAARAHVEAIVPVVDQALNDARVRLCDLGAIAVTNRPGLVGSLSVGVSAAKALAHQLQIPLIGVHHLEGHLLSPLAADSSLTFPHLCLLVSGGHTELVRVNGIGEYGIVGQTRDDAAGEAFDKCARLLGFPYPGGKELSETAISGNRAAIKLPRGLDKQSTSDFSFSGLKTAVLRVVQQQPNLNLHDLAASIEEAIVSVLAERTLDRAELDGVLAVTLAGGVAANSRLRHLLEVGCGRLGIDFKPAPISVCTDNAAMIALAATFRLAAGEFDSVDMDCMAVCDLPSGLRSNGGTQ